MSPFFGSLAEASSSTKKRRHSVAAGEKLPGAAAARRGHSQRRESRGARSGKFALSRVAGKGVRGQSGPCRMVFRDFAGKKNAEGISNGRGLGRPEFLGAPGAD